MAERRTRRRTPPRPWAPSPPALPAGAAASERLRRLLLILPLASREEGASLSELAGRLGVDEATVLADLREVQERSYDLPAGSGADVQIVMDGTRVHVWTPGEFRRPLRLSPREALALGLGLRLASLSPAAGDGEGREALRRRLEGSLAVASAGEALERFGAPDLEGDPEGVRERVAAAVRERRPLGLRYLTPGDAAPEERRVHPHLLVHGEGAWYLLAWCEKAGAVRSFRMDRILEAAPGEGPLRVDPDFDPADHVGGGRVFRADVETEAVLWYGPAVARWIAEREEGTWTEDGGFVVRRPVADPAWLARHVLQYGGEARVLAPDSLRAAVAEAAVRVAGRHR